MTNEGWLRRFPQVALRVMRRERRGFGHTSAFLDHGSTTSSERESIVDCRMDHIKRHTRRQGKVDHSAENSQAIQAKDRKERDSRDRRAENKPPFKFERRCDRYSMKKLQAY